MAPPVSRRAFLRAGSGAVAASLAGCSAVARTGSVDLTVVNLPDEPRTVAVRRRRGDRVREQRVDLPAREPNDGYAVEITNALRNVRANRAYSVRVAVEAASAAVHSPLALTCADEEDEKDAVVVRILEDDVGSVTPHIKVRSCG